MFGCYGCGKSDVAVRVSLQYNISAQCRVPVTLSINHDSYSIILASMNLTKMQVCWYFEMHHLFIYSCGAYKYTP